MSEGTQRKLAAIVAVDVVGYSRLMGEDEAGTLAALRQFRAKLFEPTIAEFHGEIAKSMGDGWLVAFNSAADAVGCAIATQEKLSGHDVLQVRIGLHVGDVTYADGDIFGDGVNIAARLQEIAEPGTIVISENAKRSIDGKLAAGFTDLGQQNLKNIVDPVSAFGWGMSEIAKGGTALPLPDKPSIAVLPFDNMSGDLEQEYFADGMTEDIITALSRFRWLFVTARNSTFTYKGQAIDVKQVGYEMGVRYVLEGSVRKSGQRVRVTAQLIEAATGNHIWAERYDRDLVDIFDLQDELTQAISTQVDSELAVSERDQAHKKLVTNMDAWDLYQRGMWHLYQMISKDDMAKAQPLLQLACKRAPEFANAYAGLAFIAYAEVIFGYKKDKASTLEQALRDAETAVALDNWDGYNHFVLGRINMLLGDGNRAISALRKSIDLNPSSAQSHYGLGFALYWFGRAEEAIPILVRAIRFSPRDTQLWTFHNVKSLAHSVLDEFDLAVIEAKAAIQAKSEEFWPYVFLASAYGLQGNSNEARAAYDSARKLNPELSAAFIKVPYGTMHTAYLEKFLAGLRKAGMPEE